MNAKTSIAAALLSLCACGGSVTVGQLPTEAGVDATASNPEAGPLQDAGASVPAVDATTAEAGAAVCQGANPVSCAGRPDACQPGSFCDTDPTHGCAPSYCNCDRQVGWSCTADCAVGVCRPIEDAGAPDAAGPDADLPDATPCCDPIADYISCHLCVRCTPNGVLPFCPPGRFCAPGNPVCQLVDAGVDAEAPTDAGADASDADASDADAGDGATDADAAPMCLIGTPLTLGPCPPRDN